MKSKISTSRLIRLLGTVSDGSVAKVPVVCLRKNVVRSFNAKSMRRLLQNNNVLGFVSHPTVSKSKSAQYVDAWCHCYKNHEDFIGDKPQILISESDFIDPLYIKVNDRSESFKWDYYCFVSGGKQSKRKGVGLLCDILPVLNSLKLNGIVIDYGRQDLMFENKKQQKLWDKNIQTVKFCKGPLSASELSDLMSCSRFGLFTSGNDCSPLLLAESIVRDCPVLVNTDIIGGWKYVNENTGCFFDRTTIKSSTIKMMSQSFSPQQDFMKNYGFKNTSERLANFINNTFGLDFKLVCFSGLSHLLENVK